MITILFDIDGTLMRSGGAGMKAIETCMRDLFGLQSVQRVVVHGRTDYGILSELFAVHGLSYDEHRQRFDPLYWRHLEVELARCEGFLLPGVQELIPRIAADERFAQGILTGNSKRAASIKLRHFGLDSFFRFGGYGDDHAARNDVAKLAKESAKQVLGSRFLSDRVWVIGDTIHDVSCARAIDSRSIAVATGGAPVEELQQSEPDWLLNDLSCPTTFVNRILEEA